MSGFTDYHAHFVYGVDDGARTREEMFAMLDAAAADGVTRLFATALSTPGMEPFPRDVYQRHLDFARAYCAEKGYDLMLESGAELLAEERRRTFLQKWQERKRETITHPFLEEKLPWGLVPYVQSLLLARYLRGDLEEYPPFLWK